MLGTDIYIYKYKYMLGKAKLTLYTVKNSNCVTEKKLFYENYQHSEN